MKAPITAAPAAATPAKSRPGCWQQLLNDPETRSGLAAHGISLPEDTLFVAGPS